MLSTAASAIERVGHVDDRELLGLGGQRAVAGQVLDGGLELRVARAAAVEPHEVAGADERVGVRLEGGRARRTTGGTVEMPPASRTVPTTSSTAVGPWTSPSSKPVSKRK